MKLRDVEDRCYYLILEKKKKNVAIAEAEIGRIKPANVFTRFNFDITMYEGIILNSKGTNRVIKINQNIIVAYLILK